jgi:predicted transcriptional regulator YheO
MAPTDKKELFDFLTRLTHALGASLGKDCEVVLHDFSHPEESVIAIANGHITGRKVGATLDVLGFQLLRNQPTGDFHNYQTVTKSGKILRSSTTFLRDENGQIYGALCMNHDISSLVKAQELLQGMLVAAEGASEGPHEEFEDSVEEVLSRMIEDSIRSTGKEVGELTRDEKVTLVARLESKGAFLIRYSVDRIAKCLSLSKYTIYNYLEEVKARNENSAGIAGYDLPLTKTSSKGESAESI